MERLAMYGRLSWARPIIPITGRSMEREMCLLTNYWGGGSINTKQCVLVVPGNVCWWRVRIQRKLKTSMRRNQCFRCHSCCRLLHLKRYSLLYCASISVNFQIPDTEIEGWTNGVLLWRVDTRGTNKPKNTKISFHQVHTPFAAE